MEHDDADLKDYLAAQNAAVSPADGQDPVQDADPLPTDRDPADETPADDAPGDDQAGTDDETDAEDGEPPETAAAPSPEVAALQERLAAIERDREQERAQIAQWQAQQQLREAEQAAQAEYARLQARWAAMDEDEAAKEQEAVMRSLEREELLRVTRQRDELEEWKESVKDIQTHKPRAIAFLAEKHKLTKREVAYLEKIDDALVMVTVAQGYEEARQQAEQEARQQARTRRIAARSDKIGSSSGVPVATAPTTATGGKYGDLIDYLNEQKQTRPGGPMAAPRRA